MLRLLKNNKSRPFIRAVFLCSILILPACAKVPLDLNRYNHQYDTPSRFHVCHGYGCRARTPVIISNAEWARIKAPLKTTAKDAAAERKHLAQSIATMESITGEVIGTDKDRAGATMRGYGPFQLDCIDEAINTSKYITFLDEDGLLRLHDIGTPARRGSFIDGAWPHNTAVITEKATGQNYAVDSWFGANGSEPDIIPLELWLQGWEPEKR